MRHSIRGIDDPDVLERALAGYASRDRGGDAACDQDAVRHAGVLIPLVMRDAGLSMIMIRRSAHLKHHPGQVGLPGGKVEQHDADSLAAALRETREEVGIGPHHVRILGSCPAQPTSTGFLIKPYVALVDPSIRVVPSDGEVEEVFEVPFACLAATVNYQPGPGTTYPGTQRGWFIDYGRHHIWGATARILHDLATHLEATCV